MLSYSKRLAAKSPFGMCSFFQKVRYSCGRVGTSRCTVWMMPQIPFPAFQWQKLQWGRCETIEIYPDVHDAVFCCTLHYTTIYDWRRSLESDGCGTVLAVLPSTSVSKCILPAGCWTTVSRCHDFDNTNSASNASKKYTTSTCLLDFMSDPNQISPSALTS